MIDRERVIKGLACCIESYDKGFCPDECEYRGTYPDCEQGLMREARELLKLQEPKPVKIIRVNNYEWICPVCGSSILVKTSKQSKAIGLKLSVCPVCRNEVSYGKAD